MPTEYDLGPARLRRRILVVDDEPHVTRLLADRLERAGYTVVKAHNFAEMVTQCRAIRPDLVVLDTSLPDWQLQPSETDEYRREDARKRCLGPFCRTPGVVVAPVPRFRPLADPQICALLEQDSGLPLRVLFLSHASPASRVEWDCSGAASADVLTKPFSPAELLEKVSRLISDDVAQPSGA